MKNGFTLLLCLPVPSLFLSESVSRDDIEEKEDDDDEGVGGQPQFRVVFIF